MGLDVVEWVFAFGFLLLLFFCIFVESWWPMVMSGGHDGGWELGSKSREKRDGGWVLVQCRQGGGERCFWRN